MGGTPSLQKAENLELPQEKNSKIDEDIIVPFLPKLEDKTNVEFMNPHGLEHSFTFSVFREIPSFVNRYKNYGDYPVGVIHTVCLYLELRDLASIFRSCKLFNVISNTTYFWKEYYENIKGDESRFFSNSEVGHNWKMNVFNSTFSGMDYFYRRKYKKIGWNICGSKMEGVFEGEKYPLKIVLLGGRGAGRTTFLHRFRTNEYIEDGEGSVRAAFVIADIGYETRTGKQACVKLEIWDCAVSSSSASSPQDRFKSNPIMYYRGHSGCIVFFDVSSRTSFNQAKGWVKEVQRNCDRSYLVLVASKIETEFEKREVDTTMAREFAELRGIPYCEISSKKNWNIFYLGGLVIDGAIKMRRQINKEIQEETHK